MSRARTVVARFSPSSRLPFGSPVVSVWPMTVTSGAGRSLTALRTVGSTARDVSVNSSDSKRKYRLNTCTAAGRCETVEPNTFWTSASLIGAGTLGGWFGATRVELAACVNSTVWPALDTTAFDCDPGSGSGSSTVSVCSGCAGVLARFGPQAATQAAAITASTTGPSHRRVIGYGVTRIARRVPRTPTIPDGVSRRTASGDSLAIRPDT